MVQPGRALEALDEAAPAVRVLEQYEDRPQLAAALAQLAAAVERALRLLLRSDTGAPDDLRLAALSPKDLPLERVLVALRERDRISLELAGAVHALARAAAQPQPTAGDADTGLAAERRLRTELAALAPVASPAPDAAQPAEAESEPAATPGAGRRATLARYAPAAAGLLAVAVVALLLARPGGGAVDTEDALAAFRRGDLLEAASGFRRVLGEDPDDVTARLYLARIERRGGRMPAAADHLQHAAAVAPSDADVRRELGHLFLELGRPSAAAEQYRRSVELEPAHTLGWVGLARALRAAGDDQGAEEVLRRAPAEAREVIER